ncbi:Uncharacterised protein [Clostridium sporogenes]|uniref:Uncharacterized protein n=1 Tax=Clostridium sporogenes TaxID=1509 RepID=A0A7U4JPY7_CLOSG|nr:hypothetical protein [Clostridium sporogenes]AKC63154.1 hypothetical protein CLSPO_c24340 [Clostridium sporogenes]AKJ90353.1 hypothetical protein CLSPOx_12200 [Clostridium sporogenes]KCZ67841.1 hypothetical protein CSPO_7c01840 [Clostridium sporogenes]OOO65496.1 hypothetical protein BS099_14500 [Clostridium sporogenes]SQC39977.1 Uncharacterised protein [Clostridium sporogenes]
MSNHWKKSFRKVPREIVTKLESLKSDDVVVACVKKIPLTDIQTGIYKHLNITINDGNISYDKIIVPDPKTGRYSRYNLHGKVIPLKNLPKVNKYYSVDVPNFGDWSKGSHEITWNKKIYQKKYMLPREIYLNVELLSYDQANYIFKFSLDTILIKDQVDLMDELLFHCCLLQENTGLCDIFEANAKNEDYIKTLYVGWELLPPGIKYSEVLSKIFKKSKSLSPESEAIIKERLQFFKTLKIKNSILGESKFNRYFGAIFDNGYVLLENVKYGNAIYIFKDNWQELSKLSRIELQRINSKDVIRIPHSTNWKNNVKQALKGAS